MRAHLDTGLRHHDAAAAPPDLANPLLDLARGLERRSGRSRRGPPAGRGSARPRLVAPARSTASCSPAPGADVVAARETLRKTNGRVATLEAQLAERDSR